MSYHNTAIFLNKCVVVSGGLNLPEGNCPRNGVITVHHHIDAMYKFVDVEYFIEMSHTLLCHLQDAQSEEVTPAMSTLFLN